MSSPDREKEEPSSSTPLQGIEADGNEESGSSNCKPPAKRRISSTVIEISDTESDDSDVCAVKSYQASADEVKRIRRDYSSTSSSSDYSSDSESGWEDDSILVDDEKSSTKAVPALLNTRANRLDNPKLNTNIKSQEIIEKLSEYWKECKDHSSCDITLTCEPFRLCLLKNFLSNPDIINNIVDDMNTLDWSRKKMDLYEFHQTTDLASLTWQRSIRGIYELLKTEVMGWVSKITGLELTSVSASCSLYGPGDHLLVHDDMMTDRRVAFIFYLAPWKPLPPPKLRVENGGGDDHDVIQVDCDDHDGWRPNMGGALELLTKDVHGQPTEVVHRVLPKNNMLAFFKVGHDSYHQVSEVLSLELPRLSINGWFHGPEPETDMSAEPERPSSPAHSPPQRPHSEPVLMNQWIDPTYMSPRSRVQIQAQMERESEVSLRKFLLQDKYERLLEVLKQEDVEWESSGPANQRRYSRVVHQWADNLDKEHPIKVLLSMVSGTAFFRLLADCTDLSLTTYEKLELQRWSPGDFTLLPPREHYQQSRLEVVMYLGVPDRPVCGGTTTYLAPEESEAAESPGALITLPLQNNALNLVFCDSGAASFTKYLSKMTMRDGDKFYILTCTYKE